MDSGDYNEKFNSRESATKKDIEYVLENLKKAKIEDEKFLEEVKEVGSSIYSPVKNTGEKLAKNVIDFYEQTTSTLDLEMTKLKNIQKKLTNVNVKVALFGDVSAGKSQTINSILGRKIFIPAYCHTTICFVRISLAKDKESIKKPDGMTEFCDNEDEMRQKVKDCANFNGSNKLNPDGVLEIAVLKKDNDRVMRENVSLIDCPGGNDTQEVTDMIEKVVLEADIFLYILTQVIFAQQRTFFKELLTKTSAPNIFVLVNKWDETDNDDPVDTDKAFESLKSEIVSWLTEVDEENKSICEERIFFISAKETLQQKLGTTTAAVHERQKRRLDDFERFEKVFAKHLDCPKEIKVAKHIKEFDKMDGNLIAIKTECGKRLDQLREDKKKNLNLIKAKIDHLGNIEGHLCERTVDSVKELKPEETDQFLKDHLKLIEKEFENFVDVIETPPASIFGMAKSMFNWTKEKVWVSEPDKPKVDTEEGVDVGMMKYIKSEAERIRAPLQKEFDLYDKYIKALPDISCKKL